MSHQRKHNTGYILRICGIAALGGILFGYDTAVISGAIEALKTYFDLSPAETGWAVSNVVIGCVVGAFGAGPLAGRYGRKKALVVAAFLFTVSAVGAALATTFTWFVIYRIIGGLAVGLAATVSPMYMSEVSPKDMRGRALSMQQFAIVFGQIVIFYVNFKIASYASEAWLVEMGWRWMIGSEVIPCLLFTALVFVIPESPRWSVMVGRDDQALAMLTRVSNAEHAKSVLREIKESLRQDEQHRKQKLNYGDVRVRFILFVGCMIAMLQQVTGVNVMMYYAPVGVENRDRKRARSPVPDHLDRRIATGRLGDRRHADGSHRPYPTDALGHPGHHRWPADHLLCLVYPGNWLLRAVWHAVLYGVLRHVMGRRCLGAGLRNFPQPHAFTGDEHCRWLYVAGQLRRGPELPDDQ
ncbi:D-xylose transporter [Serratia fonticola]|uniref:D-xylose transporter n=1 Tax=Serratia fonticola TaxID=47917 RepID=A0A4U9TNE8_SERFO|nr:D-xylose transporter [Serratia fonticola]